MDELISVSSIVREYKKSYSNINNKIKKYEIEIVAKDGQKYINSTDVYKLIGDYKNRVGSSYDEVIELKKKLYTPLERSHRDDLEQIIAVHSELYNDDEEITYNTISKECVGISPEKVKMLSIAYYYLLKDKYHIEIYRPNI